MSGSSSTISAVPLGCSARSRFTLASQALTSTPPTCRRSSASVGTERLLRSFIPVDGHGGGRHMAHIDWLVNRDGVMFAPDLPGEPDDYPEADKARRGPADTGRSEERENDPEEMEVGDPRDGP